MGIVPGDGVEILHVLYAVWALGYQSSPSGLEPDLRIHILVVSIRG
jgi:hypothetical protein